ncbi:cytochrome b/b6 domain-containing protein [Candidatus Leptofilum sp.]|uniref:cytochrome b/b6 domain-containing protein n=1 Tax=Candidatus Leptofilum sp. TaxID=3241576 RepID=UPI003B59444B
MSTVAVKKKRKTSPAKRNLIWDIVISLGFLAVFSQEITGETLHEWLALALFAGLITHLVLHWKWVVNVTKRIFNAKLNRKTRMSYAVVLGLTISFIFMGVSGLLISESVMPTLGFQVGNEAFEDLHEAASNATLIMVGVHLLQHWKWIVTNSRKYIWGRFIK